MDVCVCVYVWLYNCDFVILEDVQVVVYDCLCYCIGLIFEVEVKGVIVDYIIDVLIDCVLAS